MIKKLDNFIADIAPFGIIVLFVMSFFLIPVADKVLEQPMMKFNDWANDMTKGLPDISECYIHWDFLKDSTDQN